MNNANEPIAFAGLAVLLAAGMAVYAGIIRHLRRHGGKVRSRDFDSPELIVAGAVIAFFAFMLASALVMQPDSAVKQNMADGILEGAILYGCISLLIVAACKARGFKISWMLGFHRMPLWMVTLASIGLAIASLPIITVVGLIVLHLMGGKANEQELVTLFREVTRAGDRETMAKIVVAGIVVAPIAEEFIFRGFFYPVLKRYSGGLVAALVTAALFAACHLNLPSAPGLFVLALCFTLAYEVSGSIFVPIGMHALFNFSQLVFLFADVQRKLSL